MNKRAILIVGAGGHGQVVADILQAAFQRDSTLEPLGFLDDDRQLADRTLLGLPVFGPIGKINSIEHDCTVVAIGDNKTRGNLFTKLELAGESFANAVHPSAVIAGEVQLGRGVMVCAGAVVNTGARIGSNVILNSGCIVEHHCRIADHVHIAPGVSLGGELQIGTGTMVGLGAVVLPGLCIGAGCVVGAGAVVTHDIDDGMVVIGNPARVVIQEKLT